MVRGRGGRLFLVPRSVVRVDAGRIANTGRQVNKPLGVFKVVNMMHIMDTLPEFRKTIRNLESIKQIVVGQSEIDYRSQDARMVALDSLQITISALGMWITSFNSLANQFTEDEELNEKRFLCSVGSGINLQQTEEIMFDHLRLGFMTLAHFKLDNLFHNILKHLNALPRRVGYWNLTDEILDQCSLSKIGIEKKLLTAFANLRNSLHGNGIHRTNSLRVQVGDTTFDFVKGDKVKCASWNHIIVLLDANVDILKMILSSPKVVNIKTEIEDDFASEE